MTTTTMMMMMMIKIEVGLSCENIISAEIHVNMWDGGYIYFYVTAWKVLEHLDIIFKRNQSIPMARIGANCAYHARDKGLM